LLRGWGAIPQHFVLDNFSPHLGQQMRYWADANNIELAHSPHYASWLNRIESEFRALRYFTLAGTDHPDHATQARLIRGYIHWPNGNTHNPRLRRLGHTHTRAVIASRFSKCSRSSLWRSVETGERDGRAGGVGGLVRDLEPLDPLHARVAVPFWRTDEPERRAMLGLERRPVLSEGQEHARGGCLFERQHDRVGACVNSDGPPGCARARSSEK
jgi:hypothetical protein